MHEDKIAVNTEAMLLGWSDTSTRGKTVTFLLPEDGDSHAFKEFAIKSKKSSGQRFQMFLVELDDDETPKTQQQKTSQYLHCLCGSEMFWDFINLNFDTSLVADFLTAKTFIYDELNIESLSDLDRNDQKKKLYEMKIKVPYDHYKLKVGSVV